MFLNDANTTEDDDNPNVGTHLHGARGPSLRWGGCVHTGQTFFGKCRDSNLHPLRCECEKNHKEGVMQFTQGTRFLLTTDLSCSYHGAKSWFLFEFLKRFGKNGFSPIEPAEMNGPYEKNMHFNGVFAD